MGIVIGLFCPIVMYGAASMMRPALRRGGLTGLLGLDGGCGATCGMTAISDTIIADSVALAKGEALPRAQNNAGSVFDSDASALLAPIGCEEFGGRTVIMVTSSVDVSNMFQNWFVHTRQFLNESTDQVVVIAYDNQTLDLLTGSAERIPPPGFVVVSSEYFQAAGTTSGRRLRAPPWTAEVIGKFNFATPGFGDIARNRPSSMLHFVEESRRRALWYFLSCSMPVTSLVRN